MRRSSKCRHSSTNTALQEAGHCWAGKHRLLSTSASTREKTASLRASTSMDKNTDRYTACRMAASPDSTAAADDDDDEEKEEVHLVEEGVRPLCYHR